MEFDHSEIKRGIISIIEKSAATPGVPQVNIPPAGGQPNPNVAGNPMASYFNNAILDHVNKPAPTGIPNAAKNFADEHFKFETNNSPLQKINPALAHTSLTDGLAATGRGATVAAIDTINQKPNNLIGAAGSMIPGPIGGAINLYQNATKSVPEALTTQVKHDYAAGGANTIGVKLPQNPDGSSDWNAGLKNGLTKLDETYKGGVNSAVDSVSGWAKGQVPSSWDGVIDGVGGFIKNNPWASGAGLLGAGIGIPWLLSKLFGGGQQQQQPPQGYQYYQPPQPPPQAIQKYSAEQIRDCILNS